MKQELDSQRGLFFKRKVGNVYQCVKVDKPSLLKYSMVKLDTLDFNVHDLKEFSEFEEDYKFLKKLIYKFMREYDIKSDINKLSIGYEAYLNSEQWQEKRRQTIIHHGVKCKDCGDNAIDIHHLHYRTLYFENPKTDLIPLCRKCHSKRHGHD